MSHNNKNKNSKFYQKIGPKSEITTYVKISPKLKILRNRDYDSSESATFDFGPRKVTSKIKFLNLW